jgi:hypothetical protein
MSAPGPAEGKQVVALEVYGTRACVSVPDPELVPRVVEQFPRDSTACEPRPDDRSFALEIEDDGRYAVVEDGTVGERPPTLEGALGALRRRLFFYAMEHARDRLVVSAGAVGYEGHAIVLPGPTMAGKTRLVLALLRAGAEYYADDWALLDGDGRVHGYSSPIHVKNEGKVTPESLGAVRGAGPIPVGLIASVTYKQGSHWSHRRRTAGDGVLMLLRNAYGMDAPDFALDAARSAAGRAVVLEGERGDAEEAAAALLECASEMSAQTPPGRSP